MVLQKKKIKVHPRPSGGISAREMSRHVSYYDTLCERANFWTWNFMMKRVKKLFEGGKRVFRLSEFFQTPVYFCWYCRNACHTELKCCVARSLLLKRRKCARNTPGEPVLFKAVYFTFLEAARVCLHVSVQKNKKGKKVYASMCNTLLERISLAMQRDRLMSLLIIVVGRTSQQPKCQKTLHCQNK